MSEEIENDCWLAIELIECILMQLKIRFSEKNTVKERIFVKVARDLIFFLLLLKNYYSFLIIFHEFQFFKFFEFSEIPCGNVKYRRTKFINYFHARFTELKYPLDKPRSIYYIVEKYS